MKIRVICVKVNIFIGGLSGGGAERVVCNIANYLSRHGHIVEILTMSDDVPTYKLDNEVLRVSLLEASERKCTLWDNFLRYLRLRKYLKDMKSDCFLVFLPITIILSLFFRKLIKAPIVITERNDPSAYSFLIKTLLRLFVNRADAVVFQTDVAQNFYVEEFGLNRDNVIIPNAINEDFIGKVYSGQRKKEIVSVGRMSEQKNFPLLIRAFTKISQKYPGYTLKIFGEGPLLETNMKLVEELKMEGKVEFPGYVKDIGEQIRESSIYVLSSNYEGMPNTLIEAMALGLPCIATDCGGGGARFLIDDGVNGLIVEINNENMMAAAIDKLLTDTMLAEKLGKNAQEICETLSPNKIYGRWLSFMETIAER